MGMFSDINLERSMAMALMVGVRYPSMTSEHGETPLRACLDLKILGEHRTTLFSKDDLLDEKRQFFK
jgi:hypothetical protein